MGRTLTIELPEDLYQLNARTAQASHQCAEELAAEWLARMGSTARQPTPDDVAAATERLRSYFGSWDSGDPDSGDNERIDADLVREYASKHEDLAQC